MPMQPMSFLELVERSPEWLTLIANVLFALVTTGVLVWQVCVMRWQGRNSDQRERIQIKITQLQFEHELVLRLNVERERVLKLTEDLSFVANCLKESETAGDGIHWSELTDKVSELDQRLRILDLRAYSDPYGKWFPALEEYVKDVLIAVIADGKYSEMYGHSTATPNLSTRKVLKELNAKHNPTGIRLDIEAAIRMAVFEFKDKWDAALKTA